jgi:hypothetical protein
MSFSRVFVIQNLPINSSFFVTPKIAEKIKFKKIQEGQVFFSEFSLGRKWEEPDPDIESEVVNIEDPQPFQKRTNTERKKMTIHFINQY